jgi:hypothetical protein
MRGTVLAFASVLRLMLAWAGGDYVSLWKSDGTSTATPDGGSGADPWGVS